MDGTKNLAARCEGQAQQVFVLIALACLLTAALSMQVGPVPLRLLIVVVIVGPLGLGLVALLERFLRRGDSPIPPATFLGGVLFMVGGTAFDIAVTLACSDELKREGNPIVRALLDADFSPQAIVAIGLIGQWALLAAGTLIWAIVFRHRASVIRSAWAARPQSPAQFIRAGVTGRLGPGLMGSGSTRSFQFPKAYHLLSVLGVCLPAGWFGRWCLGFQWLGVVKHDGVILTAVLVSTVALAFCGYLLWLHSAYVQGCRDS